MYLDSSANDRLFFIVVRQITGLVNNALDDEKQVQKARFGEIVETSIDCVKRTYIIYRNNPLCTTHSRMCV